METTRRRALGKGLEELFSTEVLDLNNFEEKIVNDTPKEEIVDLNINDLRNNPYQPRKSFDEKPLNELAESIKEHGVIQPIIVKKSIKGYEIIAGERRVRASLIAGNNTIPAIIREFNDAQMMEIALLENLQREDLNPIEEAIAYQNIMEARSLSHEDLAKKIGKSRSYVTNMVGILNLPPSIRDLVIAKKIPATHARTLSKIKDEEKIQELADRIINEGLTTHTLEELAQDKTYERRNKMERKVTEDDLLYKSTQELLCEKLGTKVRIFGGRRLEIHFSGADDLNRILEIFNISE